MNTFETDFWLPYDKKVGKDKCITKWALIPAEDQIKIKLHVPGFVSRARNKQFRPNPLSYLNGKMWLDENIETEEKIVYREIPDKPVSDYKAKPFQRSTFIQMLRKKFKAHFETGTWNTTDYNGTIHSFLTERDLLRLTDDEMIEICCICHWETIRPRNRTESPYSGVLEIDIKSTQVKKFLMNCRDKGRDLSLEI